MMDTLTNIDVNNSGQQVSYTLGNGADGEKSLSNGNDVLGGTNSQGFDVVTGHPINVQLNLDEEQQHQKEFLIG